MRMLIVGSFIVAALLIPALDAPLLQAFTERFEGAPRAMTFEAADSAGISVEHLDSVYVAAIELLGESEPGLDVAWYDMLGAVGRLLQERGLAWNGAPRVYFRVYFDATGAIDYMLYRTDDPTDAAALAPLLDEFARSYRFALSSSRRFVQCGGAQFTSQ